MIQISELVGTRTCGPPHDTGPEATLYLTEPRAGSTRYVGSYYIKHLEYLF